MSRPRLDPVNLLPRGLSADEAARYIGVGRLCFERLVFLGKMPKAKSAGKRPIFLIDELDACFSDFPEVGKETPPSDLEESRLRWWSLEHAILSHLDKYSAREWIYVIRMSEFIKIGYSRNPINRIRGLQEYSPAEIEVLSVKPGSMADERALHSRFRGSRSRGEWFHSTDAIEDWISGGCKI